MKADRRGQPWKSTSSRSKCALYIWQLRALARRLAIALWRYLEHGVMPSGALLKPVAA